MCKRQPFGPQLLLLTWGLSAVLTPACGNNPDRTAANADNRPAIGSNEKKPIDVTGCLQKADGSYVLTAISKPGPNARPAHKKDEGSVVEREQVHAAQHAYRLTTDKKDDLEKLVGKQVKMSGTVTDKSDLIDSDDRRGNDLTVGTSGIQDKNHERRQDRAQIDTGDLARVDVTSIQQVGDGCGTRR